MIHKLRCIGSERTSHLRPVALGAIQKLQRSFELSLHHHLCRYPYLAVREWAKALLLWELYMTRVLCSAMGSGASLFGVRALNHAMNWSLLSPGHWVYNRHPI